MSRPGLACGAIILYLALGSVSALAGSKAIQDEDPRYRHAKGGMEILMGRDQETGEAGTGPTAFPAGNRSEADFGDRLSALREHNRGLLRSLKADLDAVGERLRMGGLPGDGMRDLVDRIRRQRIEARLSLNVGSYLNRVASDAAHSARWGKPVHYNGSVPDAPTILVVNETRRRMAVDVWNTDSVRVGYIPLFCGFQGEMMPSDRALEKMAEVRVEVRVHDSEAAGILPGGVEAPVVEVCVSDPWGKGTVGQPGREELERGVLVYSSVLVPRSSRLILENADPVSEPDLKDVQLERVPPDDSYRRRLAHLYRGPEEEGVPTESSRDPGADLASTRLPEAPAPRVGEGVRPESTLGSSVSRRTGPYGEGMTLWKAGRLDEAAQRFEMAAEQGDGGAESYVRLGHVHLDRDDLRAAEKAFRQALKEQKDHAPGYNGLGLVYMQTRNRLDWAIRYFRDACRLDRSYAEARYNLAEAYRRFGSTETLEAYKAVVEMDLGHPDAWFQIGRIYEKDSDFREAERHYREQMAVYPEHFQARQRLGVVLGKLARTDEAIAVLEEVAAAPGADKMAALGELARVHQERRDHARAQELFEAYILLLPPREQAVYHDLSLVTSGEGLGRFMAAPRESWESLSKTFWEGRDPAPVTKANERLVEHYRRVAHAREAYGESAFPWDVRGDVYVRFGEPDHVSRSDDIRMERDRAVVAFKEALMNRVKLTETLAFKGEPFGRGDPEQPTPPDHDGATTSYPEMISAMGRLNPAAADESIKEGATVALGRGVLEPESEGKSLAEQQMADTRLELVNLGRPAYPVPRDGWWEYWIYTDVGPGIEVTFVQKHAGQPYTYAEVPFSFWMSDQSFRIWRELNPKRLVSAIAKQTPEVYRADFQSGVLAFHLDTGQYKGENGKTVLEVYYGIPDEALTFVPDKAGRAKAEARRGVAVYTEDDLRLHRSDQAMVYQAESPSPEQGSRFYAEMDRVSVPPGRYRVSAQVLDAASGNTQVYDREVTVAPFDADTLRLSDIQLATSIEPSEEGRFVRHGMKIVPNAAQAFLVGQPVYVYYEVYNLTRDTFGSTHYRVVYGVESADKASFGARILGGLGRLLGIQESEGAVTIEYDHTGNRVDDFSYLELDLVNAKPGDQILTVRVTDVNSGQEAEVRAEFVVR